MELQSGRTVELRDLTFDERPQVLQFETEYTQEGTAIIRNHVAVAYKAARLGVTKIDGQDVTEELLNTLTDTEVDEIAGHVIRNARLGVKKNSS